MSKNRLIAIVLMAVLFAALFAVASMRNIRKESKTTAQIQEEMGIPVQTATVQMGSIEDTIPVTGDLTALDTVVLSSKIPGKVASVSVREGDAVRSGQPVVQLDRSDAEASLRQARAGLESARARLSQARTNASVTDVQSSAAIRQAKAALTAAEANLQKIRKGARSQERMMAESSVATAKANLDNAQANLRRMKQLFNEGAIAEAQLDVAQTQYDVALAQYNSAKQNLSLVEEGARTEDVRAAETQVTQAREALRTAQANAAQIALRREDIKAAMAGVSQAEAQVAIAREQLSNTVVRSPISGIVSERLTEVGETVSPGVPLMNVVNLGSVYFQADVSETVLAKVNIGQAASVAVDAYPGQTFVGKVQKINPSASVKTRNFSVRVGIPNPDSKLKPGMFARGSIITGVNTSALLVPKDAVEERNGRQYVFVINDGSVDMREINTGLSNAEFIEVLRPSNLATGEVIVTAGSEYLQDDSKVYIGDQRSADRKGTAL